MSENNAHQFTRLFSTTAGQQVLQYLKNITLNRILGPAASDSELRFLEGQRALVHQI